jgi:hypothetical protein
MLTEMTVEALTVATAITWVTPSFAEVAVIVTVPPAGTVDGAVYVVETPLCVVVRLKLPQPVKPQLHVTPALCTSFVTCALSVSVPDVVTLNVEGDTDTVMGRIVIVGVLADLVLSATEVAVIVIPPEGDVVGAVYVVPTVLCVCVGLNDPQTLFAQVAFGDDVSAALQMTPSVFRSLVMVAVTGVVPPTASDAGVDDSVTMMAGFTIVIVTLEACDGSLVTRAVMVIVLSAGIVPGAV